MKLVLHHLAAQILDVSEKNSSPLPSSVLNQFNLVMSCFNAMSDNYSQVLASSKMLEPEYLEATDQHRIHLAKGWHLLFSIQKDDEGPFFLIEKLELLRKK